MKHLILVLLSLSLFSCSHQRKLERANKKLSSLISEFPELVKHDTINKTIHDTIKGVQHDTIIQSGITKDTIVIHDKQLEIKYFNNGKTVYVKGKCDTVIKEIKVPEYINNINPVKDVTVYPWWAFPSLWIAISYIILTIIIILRKFKVL